MKRVTAIISLFFCIFTTQIMAAQWKTEEIVGPDERKMEVHLYVPDTPPKLAGKRALMINLHGCAQTNENLRDLGNWESTADEYGMVIAIPDVTPGESYDHFDYLKCWYYYDTDHSRAYKSNDNLIDLAKKLIADESYNIDENQVYISGLSSGGGQTGVMGCLAPDIFAGIGINAGPTIGTGPNEIGHVATTKPEVVRLCKRFAGTYESYFETQLTSVIYGKKDLFVAKGYGDLNAEVMASIYGASKKSDFDVSKLDGYEPAGEGTIWSDVKGPRVSLIKASELDHAWPAGSGPGGTRNYVRASGVNYPAYLAKFFFENNRRVKKNHPPDVKITIGQQEGPNILVKGEITDPDPGDSIASSKIKFLDNCDKDNVLITEKEIVLKEDGSFSHNTSWPTDDTSYIPVIVAIDSQSPPASTTLEGDPIKVGVPPVPPSITISKKEGIAEKECIGISVSGGAKKGSRQLDSVQVQVDSGDYENADGTINWSYKKCDLDYGKHTVVAKISDVEGCFSYSESVDITIHEPYQKETGTTISLLPHFDTYPNERYPDAPSSGWGLCDKTYVQLNSEFGISEEFTIYGTEDGSVWCYDSKNLPTIVAPPDKEKICEEWTETLDTHESEGRAYSTGWWMWKTYIAKGTNIYLHGSSSTKVTLHANADEPGKYYPGKCD